MTQCETRFYLIDGTFDRRCQSDVTERIQTLDGEESDACDWHASVHTDQGNARRVATT